MLVSERPATIHFVIVASAARNVDLKIILQLRRSLGTWSGCWQAPCDKWPPMFINAPKTIPALRSSIRHPKLRTANWRNSKASPKPGSFNTSRWSPGKPLPMPIDSRCSSSLSQCSRNSFHTGCSSCRSASSILLTSSATNSSSCSRQFPLAVTVGSTPTP